MRLQSLLVTMVILELLDHFRVFLHDPSPDRVDALHREGVELHFVEHQQFERADFIQSTSLR